MLFLFYAFFYKIFISVCLSNDVYTETVVFRSKKDVVRFLFERWCIPGQPRKLDHTRKQEYIDFVEKHRAQIDTLPWEEHPNNPVVTIVVNVKRVIHPEKIQAATDTISAASTDSPILDGPAKFNEFKCGNDYSIYCDREKFGNPPTAQHHCPTNVKLHPKATNVQPSKPSTQEILTSSNSPTPRSHLSELPITSNKPNTVTSGGYRYDILDQGEWPTLGWLDTIQSSQTFTSLADYSWFDILTNSNIFNYWLIQFWFFVPELIILLCLFIVILKRALTIRILLKFTLVLFHIVFVFECYCFWTFRVPFVRYLYDYAYLVDNYTFVVKMFVFFLFQMFWLVIYHRFFDKWETAKIDKGVTLYYKVTYVISLSFLFLLLVLVSINDFFAFYVILEGISFAIILYFVLNFNRTFQLNTSIRYFIYNIFVSGALLIGIAALYGLFHTTNFFTIKSLLSNFSDSQNSIWLDQTSFRSLTFFTATFCFVAFFKLSCFPFNVWVLKINQLISYETLFFIDIIFKNLFFFVFFRVFTYHLSAVSDIWSILFLFIGICSVITGTLGAIGQKRIKGFFTFSSFVQMGYNLIGLSLLTQQSYASVFFLHLMYTTSYVVIIGILFYLSCDANMLNSTNLKIKNLFYVLSDLSLIRKIQPLVAITITVAILSMAGFPLTMGFFAKYYFYETLIDCGMWQLCILLMVLSCFSLYYYINVLKNLWFMDTWAELNFIYLPRFTWETFITITLFFFNCIHIFAIFIYKSFIFYIIKVSSWGSSVVLSQPLQYYMQFKNFRKQFSINTRIYQSADFDYSVFSDDWARNETAISIGKNTTQEDLIERFVKLSMEVDRLREEVMSCGKMETLFSATGEWTLFSQDEFFKFQAAVTTAIILVLWSYYIVVSLGYPRVLTPPTNERIFFREYFRQFELRWKAWFYEKLGPDFSLPNVETWSDIAIIGLFIFNTLINLIAIIFICYRIGVETAKEVIKGIFY